MFVFHADWILRYSEKVSRSLTLKRFVVNDETVSALESFKKCLGTVTLEAIDERLPLTVETDDFEHFISATLNQKNRSVAIFARTLNNSKIRYSCAKLNHDRSALVLYSDNGVCCHHSSS